MFMCSFVLVFKHVLCIVLVGFMCVFVFMCVVFKVNEGFGLSDGEGMEDVVIPKICILILMIIL